MKSARRCGAKHISKSKALKTDGFGALLEVEMSKKCTPLWREAQAAKQRGEEDEFRYPPYTYAEQYMLKQEANGTGGTHAISSRLHGGNVQEVARRRSPGHCRRRHEVCGSGKRVSHKYGCKPFRIGICQMGLKTLIGSKQIVAAYVQSVQRPPEPEGPVRDVLSDAEGVERERDEDEIILAGEIAMSQFQEFLEQFPTDEELLESEKQLSSRLVVSFYAEAGVQRVRCEA